jgi:histidinol dehydrogenase
MNIRIYRKKEIDGFLEKYESRRTGISREVEKSVSEILENVRQNGDAALLYYAKKFDRLEENLGLKLTQGEIRDAFDRTDAKLMRVLEEAIDNIKTFHQKMLQNSWLTWEDDEVVLGQRIIPLQRVGVYVPGGRAAYPSSLIMGVVPAQVAGVEEICLVTPSDSLGKVDETILAAASLLNIKEVYRIGGAHAIAALAYGTKTIPRVDKIVGPGSIYVATAKKLLFGTCGIDMVAGPSEVTILADDLSEPAFVAADLLAQAEHDPLASALLITTSEPLAMLVQKEVDRQMQDLGRQEILKDSLSEYGGIIVVEKMKKAVDLCNRLAPEHLGLHLDDAWTILGDIKNAGAIFLGSYSPEAVGDYWAGPSHILPTNGCARFFSPLTTNDFVKQSSVVSYSKKALEKHGDKIAAFALAEGLDAHANAIKKRK